MLELDRCSGFDKAGTGEHILDPADALVDLTLEIDDGQKFNSGRYIALFLSRLSAVSPISPPFYNM